MKNKFRITSIIMLFVAIVFVVYALTHPEASFPWSNEITYTMYGIYSFVMILLFILSMRK